MSNAVTVNITTGEVTQNTIPDSELRVVTSEERLDQLRMVRDSKLSATDWWVMPDRTATQAQLDYRQALRDITNTYTSLDDVVWPEVPNE